MAVIKRRERDGKMVFREIDRNILQRDDPNLTPRWFRRSSDTDLFVWEDKRGDIAEVQLAFGGKMVDWSRKHGLRTGIVEELDEPMRYPSSATVTFHNRIDIEIVEEAKSILMDEGIDEGIRRQFIEEMDEALRAQR
ncbi:MAG: hypothetical protein ACUVXI_00015 [bacterium]